MADSKKIDWFKFWVLFIMPFIGGLIFVYNYLDKNIIESYWYLHIYKGILIASISLIVLILYVFFKVYTNMASERYTNSMLNKITSIFIKFSIFFSFTLFSYGLLCIIIRQSEIPNSFINWDTHNSLIMPFVIAALFLYIFRLILERYFDMNIHIRLNYLSEILEIIKILIILIIVYSLCTYIWLLSFSFFSNLPVPGQVILDKEELNFRNNSIIYYSIQVKGPDTGLSIKMLKEESGYLHPISTIDNIEPHHNMKIISNNSLTITTLGSGKYSVFINTTEMSAGYYQVKSAVPHYEIISGVSDFYLP